LTSPRAARRIDGMSHRTPLALPLLLAACSTTPGPRVPGGDVEAEVIAVARRQEAAWNRGDLAGYMSEGYLRSPEIAFFSGGEDTRGYQPVLERYSRRYATGEAEMGRVSFDRLEAVPLGEGWAMLRGRWALDFEREQDVGGLFTLVFRRTDEGWRIVHDHTSAAAP
jgi:beta-aspartyl-peptidase (threonine type)